MVTRVENNIADRLASIPGVTAAGFAGIVPMEDGGHGWSGIIAEGRTYAGDPPMRFYNYVSPGYFQALGTRMVAGRDFTWNEIYGLRPEVIVSENFAREDMGRRRRRHRQTHSAGPGLLW